MICPHCNNALPDGMTACFHCGKLLDEPVMVNEPIVAHEPVVTYEPVTVNDQVVTYEPVTVYEQPVIQTDIDLSQYLSQSALTAQQDTSISIQPDESYSTEQQMTKKKSYAGIITAAAVLLLLGGAVGGHILGLYSLPLLPEKTEIESFFKQRQAGTPGTVTPGTDQPENGSINQPNNGSSGEQEQNPGGISNSTTPGSSGQEQSGTSGQEQTGTSGQGRTGEGVLNRFGYANLTYTYSVDKPQIMSGHDIQNATGYLHFKFTIEGDTTGIAGVFLSTAHYTWTDDRISEVAGQVIPAWKENGSTLHNNGNAGQESILVIHAGNPIPADGRLELLLYLIGSNWEPVGHILIPITIPAATGNTDPGQSGDYFADLQGNTVLKYDLPHITIYINENNPLSGVITLKNFSFPDKVTLGLYDPVTQLGWPEVHFSVSFASNTGHYYEVGILQLAGMARMQGQHGFMSLQGDHAVSDMYSDIWEFDVNAGQGKGQEFGQARIMQTTGSDLTWSFVLNPGLNVDLDNLAFIGYRIMIYDDVDEMCTYYLDSGSWEAANGQVLSNFLVNRIYGLN